MKRSILILSSLFLASIIFGGCQLFFLDTDAIIATRVAEAIDEKFAEMESDTTDSSDVSAQPTYTPYPTNTPYPTQTQQPYYSYGYSSAIGTPGGCLNAIFISETIPDNTIYTAGDGFVKSWTIQNTGYCDWNTNYRLVFLSGSAMGGDTFTYLSNTVSPGENVTLTANLTAPSSSGTYHGEWRVQSDQGLNFARFWVQIVVN
jgi:hypothetical protein